MKILVLGCDAYSDTFDLFHYCIEKYWPNHPEVIYSTETVINPYYKTICKNYDNKHWTTRIRETLKEIDDGIIIAMCDDVFIREKVNVDRVNYLCDAVNKLTNCAAITCISCQAPSSCKLVPVEGFVDLSERVIDEYKNGVNCTIWDREKLMNCLANDTDIWNFECSQKNLKGYKYYASTNNNWPIYWGRNDKVKSVGMNKGLWRKECVDFFNKEGYTFDFTKRGISNLPEDKFDWKFDKFLK